MKKTYGFCLLPVSQYGQGAVEYVLLIALIALGVVLTLNLLGLSVADVYCQVASPFGGEGTCASQKVYCQDTFDGDLKGWQTQSGSLSSKNGQMCFNGAMQTLNKCSMDSSQSDYVIKLDDVVMDKGNGYGVFFRATNDKDGLDGYAFQYDPGMKDHGYPNGAFLVRRWINGREIWTPVAIAPMSGTDTSKTPHDIEVSVKGNTFTVFMDGKQILTGTDDTYKTGGTGLRSWDDTTSCFNDYSVLETPQ